MNISGTSQIKNNQAEENIHSGREELSGKMQDLICKLNEAKFLSGEIIALKREYRISAYGIRNIEWELGELIRYAERFS